MNRKILIATYVAISSTVSAEDFNSKQYDLGAAVSVGTLLDCETINPVYMKQAAPNMLGMALFGP